MTRPSAWIFFVFSFLFCSLILISVQNRIYWLHGEAGSNQPHVACTRTCAIVRVALAFTAGAGTYVHMRNTCFLCAANRCFPECVCVCVLERECAANKQSEHSRICVCVCGKGSELRQSFRLDNHFRYIFFSLFLVCWILINRSYTTIVYLVHCCPGSRYRLLLHHGLLYDWVAAPAIGYFDGIRVSSMHSMFVHLMQCRTYREVATDSTTRYCSVRRQDRMHTLHVAKHNISYFLLYAQC